MPSLKFFVFFFNERRCLVLSDRFSLAVSHGNLNWTMNILIGLYFLSNSSDDEIF